MTVAYQQALKDAGPQQHDQLRAAQRLWIQYRDANCLYYGLGEGTIARRRGRRMHAQHDRRRAPASWKASVTSRAFSSEVGTGSRQENASNRKSRAPFRYYRNGKGSGGYRYPARTVRGVRADAMAISRSAMTASSGIRNRPYSGMSGIRLPNATMN